MEELTMTRSRVVRVGTLAVVIAALTVAASALSAAQGAGHPRQVERGGKVIDTDTTAGDGVFNIAYGHASCRRGEKVVRGGADIRTTSGLFGGPVRAAVIASRPAPKQRGWYAAWNSDLGGKGRAVLVVKVVCAKK
jgi:hypothetical protein